MTREERLKRLEAEHSPELACLTDEEKAQRGCEAFDEIFGTGSTDEEKKAAWEREHPDSTNPQ